MTITTIDLDLTNNCVLACDYCFRGAKNQRRLDLETGKKAIDWFISESGSNKKLAVALFGGEPLMEFGLIKQLVPYAKEKAAKAGKSIHFSATTNCVLINDEMIEFFRKYKMTFHTSIDGGPQSQDMHRKFPNGKGSSSIVEPNIRKVLKYWPNRTARMSVSNDTVERWMEDVNYLVGLGYKYLAMIPIPELDWTEQQFQYMQRELRKISNYYIHRYRQGNPINIKHLDDTINGIIKPKRRKSHCGAGRGYVLIKTDGSIYPCHRFGGDIDADNEQQWRLGSIFDGWSGDKREELLNFDCRKHIKADCENCIAVHTCGTTCIAVSWQCFKDIYTPHPNQCRFTKMYFTEAMRVHYILDSEENRLFIKKFHPERLNAKNRDVKRINSAKPETALIMLSNKALSPCFMFSDDNNVNDVRLSAEKLKSILKWATEDKTGTPNLLFLADGENKIEPSIAKFLESIPEQVVVPLLSIEKQKELQIPFSEKQTVVVQNVKKLIAEEKNINNRPVIVHIDRDEIEQLADLLLSIKSMIPQITLRLKNIHKLSSKEIEIYKSQLDLIRDVSFFKTTLNISGINQVQTNNNGIRSKCPAGKQMVTIGPDGKFYPCPAFVFAGLESKTTASDNSDECALCGSDKCPGCEFLKLSDYEGRKQICNVYKA